MGLHPLYYYLGTDFVLQALREPNTSNAKNIFDIYPIFFFSPFRAALENTAKGKEAIYIFRTSIVYGP
jgi:hypothetical protein